ncbi:hypothetical protein B0H63DRAFT_485692 [Podospora didyma]|uniref:Heterokaryon incompatibility domain-containing protein n=1 Tax=Podospora didyma TaxID=330526 RepID=A0AAE0K4F0_9PEZI|nr:hypothetical protein B0H63DRAFT_485692 [Podospora didyma]
MTDIYASARQVIVCINPGGNPGRCAAVRSVVRYMAVVPSLVGGENRITRGTVANKIAERYGYNAADGTGPSQEWEAFVEFLSDRWFSRVWVVQEVAMASFVEVVIGDLHIGWSLMRDAIINAYESGAVEMSNNFAKQDGAAIFSQMLELRRYIAAGQPPDLAAVLATFRACQSTEAKDKVWALIGVSKAASNGTEPIRGLDYADEPAELVVKIARYLVERGDYLRVVFAAGIGWREDQRKGVPSWVPDWTRAPPEHGYKLSAYNGASFSASPRNRPSELAASPDGMELSAVGWRIGCITQLTDPFSPGGGYTPGGFNVEASRRISPWLVEARRLAGTIPLVDTRARSEADEACYSLNEMFGLTITAGRNKESKFLSREEIARVLLWEALVTGDERELSRRLAGVQDRVGPTEELVETVKLCGVTPWFNSACLGARFALMDYSHFCLVPSVAKKGDLVCVLAGAEVPLLLRPTDGNSSRYQLIGECFVMGIMHGEMVEDYGEAETFLLC